ncbi:MAG TPA: hypothetical protein VKV02_10045 [Acidobacteriaceae bacterium]|nr:hypothetical protein [Acidobacteriaceae bacterium]
MSSDLLITYSSIVMGLAVFATGILKEDGYYNGENGEGGPAASAPSRIFFVVGGLIFMALSMLHLFGFVALQDDSQAWSSRKH